MVIFESIKYSNFLSVGNLPLEIQLNRNPITLVTAPNGSGKCVDGSTEIEITIYDEGVRRKLEEFMAGRSNTALSSPIPPTTLKEEA